MYQENLSEEDDPELWSFVMGCLAEDLKFQDCDLKSMHPIYLRLGLCRHWLRPHQTRWTADGGFAWPTGYGGNEGYSRMGLPEFDWSVLYRWVDNDWMSVKKEQGKKKLILRAAIPARTAKHRQAAIHTLWDSGFPFSPEQKLVRFYGLRKTGERWVLKATKDIFL